MTAFLQKISPRMRLLAAVATVIIIADQWSKYLAVAHLTKAFDPVGEQVLTFMDRIGRFLSYEHPPRGAAVSVIDSFWHFRYVENPGAAWGFLADSAPWFRTPFFLVVSLAAMVFIVYYFRKTLPGQTWLRFALAMVLGGAVGNFIDRVRLGYVIDFIDWHWYDKATWPTFNVADAAISVGVVLLLLDMQFGQQPEDAAEASSKDSKSSKSAGSITKASTEA